MTDHQITLPKANILVVDDTPASLRLLTGILTEQGYTVQPASVGSQALSIAQGVRFDLILLDIMMPEMDGYEVASRLKADERTKDIPVIFISAITIKQPLPIHVFKTWNFLPPAFYFLPPELPQPLQFDAVPKAIEEKTCRIC